MRNIILTAVLVLSPLSISAQTDFGYNQIDEDGNITQLDGVARKLPADSLGSDQEIPTGLHVWTVDGKFGDIHKAEIDTVPHMFMNTIFTTGLRGEYNTTGNLGAPRIARIFIDRPQQAQFLFTQPYDFFITAPDQFHFTQTRSPITNITYNTCGDRTDGEDHLIAKFAANAGKRIGIGFKFDYIYGRGYYSDQSTSHFDYTMYGSYIGDRYQAHLLMSTNHQKVAENGGITEDEYITHPEAYSESYQTSEIPTVLTKNWNRNDNQHVFFTQRYNVGFNRKVPMTEEEIEARKFAIAARKDAEKRKAEQEREKNQRNGATTPTDEAQPTFAGRPDNAKIMGIEPKDSTQKDQTRIAVNGKHSADSIMAASQKQEEDTSWLKNEYVPVTSFIHTLSFDSYRRIYEAYETPDNFYLYDYNVEEKIAGDSIYDKTTHYSLTNTFAISLLEGFNKWAKAGLKGFVTSNLRHFTLPDSVGRSSYNEHNLSVGAQLSKTQGQTLHYMAQAETWLSGEDAGQLRIDASADVNFPLFGDTVTLAASGFLYRDNPTFYYRHYHARHLWWDNGSLDKIIHSRIQGVFAYRKTRTTLRVAFDEIKNYTYYAQSYDIGDEGARSAENVTVNQCSSPITLLTMQLSQDFTLGPLNWESVLTLQKTTNKDVLPLPTFNAYSNLYLRFKIARVLKCDFGADLRYFTKYYAPDYSPQLGQFTVQNGSSKTEVGNYPLINVYANFHLKHTRFFVMASHVNAGSGNKGYFLAPHYPLNERVIRFGLSWNFFN